MGLPGCILPGCGYSGLCLSGLCPSIIKFCISSSFFPCGTDTNTKVEKMVGGENYLFSSQYSTVLGSAVTQYHDILILL